MKKLDQQDKIYLLLALFIGALLAANFLGAKITAFAVPAALAIFLNAIFWPIIFVVNLAASPLPDYQIINNPFLAYNFFNTIHVSVGILTVPVMFLITDIIEEVMGKKTAQKFVNAALGVMIFVIIITTISVGLPPDPSRQYFSQEAYKNIFGVSLRMMVASIIAFILAQYHDIWAFNFWKKKTSGKWLWLRNNASTIVSQLIDSIAFMFIAFYAITPQFNVVYIFSLIMPYWIFKVLFALLDTPFCYLGVKWLNNENK